MGVAKVANNLHVRSCAFLSTTFFLQKLLLCQLNMVYNVKSKVMGV